MLLVGLVNVVRPLHDDHQLCRHQKITWWPRLRRHGLRHTGPTWLADVGVKVHDLRKIAGHASLTTAQRHRHTSYQSVTEAGALLAKHLRRSTDGPQLRAL